MTQVKSKTFQFILNSILSAETPAISINDAAANKDDYIFLDAREPEEYNVSHIPNARFVGYKQFNISQIGDLLKSKPLIVYCSIGKRSEKITQKLMKEGFSNVRNLYGGIFEWVNKGNVVFDSNNTPTNRVHAYGHVWGKWLEKGEKVY